MAQTVRFGLSMDSKLLEQFDQLLKRKGYANRSEAFRDLIRKELVEEEWKAGDKETVGTITLVYNHETRELTDHLTDLQHRFTGGRRPDLHIVSTLHVHLDEHNCLEVLVVKGKSSEVKKAADRLIGTKGVKHGKLTMTTTGKELV